jgi:hypothetical protein
MSLLQKGDLFTTETTEITETKDYFIFHQKYDCKNFYYMRQAAKKIILLFMNLTRSVRSVCSVASFCSRLNYCRNLVPPTFGRFDQAEPGDTLFARASCTTDLGSVCQAEPGDTLFESGC